MKAQRPYPRATITQKGERAITAGHPWVYEAEVTSLEPAPGSDAVPNGALVDVISRKGSYLGTGLLSQCSKIRIRLITRNANDTFDQAFWKRKVAWAWEYRKTVMGADASCCRVFFSEADGFPGMVVDRFNDVLVAETLSVGMEQLKPVIFGALLEVLAEDGVTIRGLYERNDASTRKLEGLRQTSGWFAGAGAAAGAVAARAGESAGSEVDSTQASAATETTVPSLDPLAPCAPGTEAFGPTSTEIVENGVRYQVDFENGQKTGFFLDQKYNRRAVAKLAAGRHVLDCFTHTGSFALNAASGGAAYVNAVDISQLAVDQARKNAQLNGLEGKMDFTAANVFDLLTDLDAKRDRTYDFIVLDPPAFTKSRKTINQAARGYKEINYRAMKLLPRGGYLATCSCSHFMDTDRFKHVVASAAHDAGVQLRQIEERQQAPDHPIVWGIPETNYLKFFIFQVV